jgi:RNA polymerase sigma-70 factor (ECF subfamily)
MHTTSASLLERLRTAPDRDDWSRFVNLYTPLLFYWARRAGLVQEDAEDLVQDVFAVLLRKLPEFRYDAGRSFRSWLCTITLNKWRDRQRRVAHAPATSQLPASGIAASEPEDLSEFEYRQQLVGRAMELIEPEFQPTSWQAFWQTAVAGRPPAEVATELGLSRNAVYVARCRILERLRCELDGLLE